MVRRYAGRGYLGPLQCGAVQGNEQQHGTPRMHAAAAEAAPVARRCVPHQGALPASRVPPSRDRLPRARNLP